MLASRAKVIDWELARPRAPCSALPFYCRLSVCSGQRRLKIRMPSDRSSAGHFDLAGQLVRPRSRCRSPASCMHLACCACSACSAPHLRRFRVTEASRRAGPLEFSAFIKLSAGSRLNQAYFGSAELAFVRRSKSPSKHLLWQRRFASERGLGTSETSRSPRVLSFHQALSRQPAEAYFGSAELAFVRRSKSQSKHLLWQRQLASERGLDTSDTISYVFIASLNSHVFIATLNSHP